MARVSVKVGRKYGKVDQSATASGKMLTDDLLGRIFKSGRDTFIRVSAPELARRIAARIDTELGRAGTLIANSMIGQESGAGPTTTLYVDEPGEFDEGMIYVRWKELASATLIRKKKDGVPGFRRFFLHTGKLRSELRMRVGPALQRLNKQPVAKNAKRVSNHGVTVELEPAMESTPTQPRFKLAEVTIKLLPGIRTGSLSQAFNNEDNVMALERRLGLTPTTLTKLAGPPIHGRHRSLITPALNYIVRHRIPRAIEKAVKSASGKRKTD